MHDNELHIGEFDNNPFTIDGGKFLTGRSAIMGMSGSGKSYLIGVLCEELCKADLPFIIIDPEGEYKSLKEKFDIVWACNDPDADVLLNFQICEKLAEVAVNKNLQLIFDTSESSNEFDLVEEFLKHFYRVEDKVRKPMLLILEEADRFAPQSKGERIDELMEISRRGRKRGIGLVIATQRPAMVDKNILSQCGNQFIGRLRTENDLNAVSLFFRSKSDTNTIPDLEDGHFYSMGDISSTVQNVHIRKRETTHGGGTPGRAGSKKVDLKDLKVFQDKPMKMPSTSSPAGSPDLIIEDVFLIYNDGRLINHQTRRLKPDVDNEILSSMFTAVQNFIKDSFGSGGRNKVLERLDFGDNSVFIEHGDNCYLAMAAMDIGEDELQEQLKCASRDISNAYSGPLKNWSGDFDEFIGVETYIQKLLAGEYKKGCMLRLDEKPGIAASDLGLAEPTITSTESSLDAVTPQSSNASSPSNTTSADNSIQDTGSEPVPKIINKRSDKMEIDHFVWYPIHGKGYQDKPVAISGDFNPGLFTNVFNKEFAPLMMSYSQKDYRGFMLFDKPNIRHVLFTYIYHKIVDEYGRRGVIHHSAIIDRKDLQSGKVSLFDIEEAMNKFDEANPAPKGDIAPLEVTSYEPGQFRYKDKIHKYISKASVEILATRMMNASRNRTSFRCQGAGTKGRKNIALYLVELLGFRGGIPISFCTERPINSEYYGFFNLAVTERAIAPDANAEDWAVINWDELNVGMPRIGGKEEVYKLIDDAFS